MTTIIEAPAQTRELQVRLDPAGEPLAILHDGRIWLLDPDTESQHWFGRDAWGTPGARPPSAAATW